MYCEIEDHFEASDLMNRITPDEKKVLQEETTKLHQEHIKLQAALVRTPVGEKSESSEDVRVIYRRLHDIERDIANRQEETRRVAELYVLGRGFRRVGKYFIKGTGHLKDSMPDGTPSDNKGVPIVVDRHTAELMGWEVGKKVIVTAVPSDAPHSTKSAVIVGISEGVNHRISWSPGNTRQLGKDHDGDALYIRGASTGYWNTALAELDKKLAAIQFSGKPVPGELADMRTELQAYADSGWMEISDEHMDAMWTMFADKQLQTYADRLYKKFKIPGAFSKEAVAFIRSFDMFRSEKEKAKDAAQPEHGTHVVTPLDTAGRTWITSNYVGATAGIIGKVANVRRRVEFFVQTYPKLVTKDQTVLDRVNMANTILVNHAVDAPAQEHLFGYAYKSNGHYDWCMEQLFGDRLPDEEFNRVNGLLGRFLQLQKSKSDKGIKIPTEVQYTGFHLLSRLLPKGSYMASLIE
jgi:hypothetical protein